LRHLGFLDPRFLGNLILLELGNNVFQRLLHAGVVRALARHLKRKQEK
jgi:hypothetical protein